MNHNTNDVMAMMSADMNGLSFSTSQPLAGTTTTGYTVSSNGLGGSGGGGGAGGGGYGTGGGPTGAMMTAWDYWQNYYYPTIIRESYPVYIKERAEDKGRQAFEILKILQDKKLLKVDKVSDFIEAMDSLIKVL